MKILFGLTTLLILLPMWYILLYQILDNVPVEPWVWSIFWVYLPLSVTLSVVGKVFEEYLSD